jgi:electron transport complex protein RnfC
VVAIEENAHASGRACAAVVIETAPDSVAALPTFPEWRFTDAKQLIEHIGAAGVVGMGGAGFPTRVKLRRPATSDRHRDPQRRGVRAYLTSTHA